MILEEALQKYPADSDLLGDKSFVDFKLGQINMAITDAQKAIEINSYNHQAYVELAFAYYAQGQLKSALTAAEKGVALYPKYDRTHYILGLCYMDSGMKEDAIKEFETFLNLYWERPIVKDYKANAERYLERLK